MRRISDSAGKVVRGCGLALALTVPFGSADAAGLTVLYAFKGGSDGGNPQAGLIADSTGNLYGTTGAGGTNNYGTVFKLATNGTKTTLYKFTGGSDGANPYGQLILDKAGNFYSTTFYGGVQTGSSGLGTVFKLVPNGTVSVLHAFSYGTDGADPQAGLTMSKGYFYGTAEVGGAAGNGAVFKQTAQGVETVLYSFKSGTDGVNPFGNLIADSAGNLYGTTEQGGTAGNGTVFKVTPSGTETVLYSFKGGSDGANPYGGLVADSAGSLYSTTYYGGGTGCGGMGCGTVFKLTSGGVETVIHSFAGGNDGSFPEAGLLRDTVGNVFGTTFQGGSTKCGGLGCGTVFKVTAAKVESVLHAFAGGSDGAFPTSELYVRGTGVLYGTTLTGGAANAGTVFMLPKT